MSVKMSMMLKKYTSTYKQQNNYCKFTRMTHLVLILIQIYLFLPLTIKSLRRIYNFRKTVLIERITLAGHVFCR